MWCASHRLWIWKRNHFKALSNRTCCCLILISVTPHIMVSYVVDLIHSSFITHNRQQLFLLSFDDHNQQFNFCWFITLVLTSRILPAANILYLNNTWTVFLSLITFLFRLFAYQTRSDKIIVSDQKLPIRSTFQFWIQLFG